MHGTQLSMRRARLRRRSLAWRAGGAEGKLELDEYSPHHDVSAHDNT